MIKFILENFDTIFKNENSLETLNKIILDLAIKGKLVPQNENDEPAGELLKRIQAEKERLIKEKIIKKEKPLPKITEEEIPFDIPKNWEWVRLEKIIELLSGQDIPTSKCNSLGKGIPYLLGASNIEENTNEIKIERWIEVPRIIAKKGELLISCKGTVGKIIVCPLEEVNLSRQLMGIKLFIGNMDYLKIFFKSYVEKLKNKSKGLIPGIAREDILKISFPLPPLEEQKRIVEKVEKLQEFIKNLKEIYSSDEKNRNNLKKSLLTEIKKSYDDTKLLNNLELVFNNFDKIVKTKEDIKDIRNLILSLAIKGKLVPQNENDEPAGELLKRIQAEKERLIKEKIIKKEKPLPKITEEEIPFDIPKNWEWVRFFNLCSVLTCGYASTPKYEKKGKIFISARNVKPYKFLLDNYKFISEELYKKLTINAKPEKGDILLTRVGAGIGEATIINVDLDFAIYVSLTLIKLIKNGAIAKYILLYINSQFFRNLMIENTFGKNTSQGNLNVKKLRELLIPLPPLKEQKRIVEKVENLMEICNLLEEKINISENISENLLKSFMNNGE